MILVIKDHTGTETVTGVTRIEEVKQGRTVSRNTIEFFRANTIDPDDEEVRGEIELNRTSQVTLLPHD